MSKVPQTSGTDEEAADIAQKRRESKELEAKIEKERKELEAQKKKQAHADYDERLKIVRQLKQMTDTPAWQIFYIGIQGRIKTHGLLVLDAEKTRDVIQHQEGVKILKGLIQNVRQPVEDLNGFVNNMPLFAPSEVARANFNEALGTVELTR